MRHLKQGIEWVRRRKTLVCVGIAAMVVGGFYWCTIWEWMRSGGAPDSAETNGQTLRNLSLSVAVAVGLLFAYWRNRTADKQTATAIEQSATAIEQKRISERGQQNERYQKGADMLGSETFATRMGGILSLERLAKERSDEFHLQVMDLLASFARLPTKDESLEKSASEGDDDRKTARDDVVEAVKAIGRRNEQQIEIDRGRKYNSRINLSDVSLIKANLKEANLSGVVFEGAKLNGANLFKADLSGVMAFKVELKKAILSYVNLFDISLVGAKLNGADFSWANLTGAEINGADIDGAIFGQTNLSQVECSQAKNLTQEQLDGACQHPDFGPPTLPVGIIWDEEAAIGRWHKK